MIKIDPGPFNELKKKLDKVQRDQIPFATALALTKTAQRVKDAEIAWMQGGIEGNATPWTLKSLYLKSAKKNKLAEGARVWFKDNATSGTAAGDYLKPQVYGGKRDAKPGERAVRGRHAIGNGRFLVPGRMTPKNAYGNVSGAKAAIKKILTDLREGGDRKKGYFAGTPKGRTSPAGLWQRKGKKLRLYAIETGQPQYRAKFDFFGLANKTVAKFYDYEFAQALSHAMRTAK